MTAVIGGIGTFAAWVSVLALHVDARYVGTGWMVVGLIGYVHLPPPPGLDLTSHHKIEHRERPAFFVELEYHSAIVPIFGTDVDASALRAAAKLVGEGATVEAIYVLRVPNQLSLDAGLEDEEQLGLERARERQAGRAQGRTEGADAADPHPQPGRGDRRGGASAQTPRSSISAPPTRRRPSGRSARPRAYLLAHRPCRVVIETPPANGRNGAATRPRRVAGAPPRPATAARPGRVSPRTGSPTPGSVRMKRRPSGGSILRRRLAMCARSTCVSSP